MRLVGHRPRAGMLPARSAALAALPCLALLLLFLAPSAQAAPFEQVGVFAGSATPLTKEQIEADEEIQLGGVGGMAVNYTGNGGVPKGTVYAASETATAVRVAMFEPSGGKLEFVESWVATTGGGPYRVCGPTGVLPNGESTHPNCSPQVDFGSGAVDVDVDQTTGNVYVLNAVQPGSKAVVEYPADGGNGEEEITRFAERAPFGEEIASSPTKLHQSPYPGGLAVNAAGEVFLFDVNNFGGFRHRLMVFRPENPGDFEHYVYSGEIRSGGTGERLPTGPVFDKAGNLYLGGGTGSETIEMVAPEAPAAFPGPPLNSPVCTFEYPKSGITAVTVNPANGEVFFFSYKKPKQIHRLSACEGGEFKETGTIAVAPERGDLWGLAFDPVREFSPGRPAGVLYAGTPTAEPSTGVGKGEPGQSSLGYVFAPATGAPKFKLTVTKSGTGQGYVSSFSPFGVLCGVTCSAEFDEGSEVELKQAAAGGSEFVKWTGACTGSEACKVTITEAKAVTAEFGPLKPKFKLSVTELGTGTGTITSTPAGIFCGASCSAEFAEGKEVELKQEAGVGSEFLNWGGVCSGTGACKVTMSSAKEVSAEFAAKPKFKLSVTKSGTGTGTVTSNPAGIECGGTCEAEFSEGSEVELKQAPEAGSEFKEWKGACTGTGACKVTITEAKAVTAEFGSAKPKLKLSVSKSGTGTGKVTSTPAGISCGETCSAEFEEGKEVELKQEASPGSEFKEWTGACSGSGACKVTMTEAKAVSVLFEPKPTPEFTLTVTVTGEGEVSANAGTISGCTSAGGANCKSPYKEGAKVTLTETPGAGQQFGGWGTPQCDESTATTCLVEVKGDEGVAASFAAPKPKFKLSVTKPGTGAGKATSTPAGVDCGATCSFEYEEGKEVELKETPEAGSEFVKWSGACTGSGSCKVTMSEARSVGAEFKLLPKPKFKLKVKKTGTGTGKVESSSPVSPKIDCGATCEAEFEEGTKVTLSQLASPGSKFTEWTGACTGTTTCEVTMSAAKEVGAKFDLVPKFKLTVSRSGTGAGKVTSTPAGIDCGATCSAEYEEGKEVELKESAEAGSEFVKWSGACTGSGSCEVTMSAAKEVGAEFKLLPKPKFKLSVTKSGTGTGKVTSTPAGIDCGATCSFEYEEGKLVELKEEPSAGSEFKEWSGACTGTGTCKVTMSAAKSVGARFDLVPMFKLTVSRSGTGTGTVTSTPAGIECGETCSAEYEAGTEVELEASAEEGSEFLKWAGACTGQGPCQVTMSAAKSVTAIFKATPTYRLLVQKSGTGQGRVTSAPITDIDCGSVCEAKLPAGTEVELTATPSPGSEFFQWSGACSGQGTCKVTMDSAKTVHATFKALPSFKLSLIKTGSGTVTSSPAGIDCGSVCEHEYPAGTAIALTATPAHGYRLKGWSGCDSASGPTCTLTMGSARSVSASFVLAKCKRGFHKGKANGKPRCVRTKRHAHHRHRARNSLALPVLWP